MKKIIRISLAMLVFLSFQGFANQNVDGVFIDYLKPFSLDVSRTQQTISSLPNEAKQLVTNFAAYGAPGYNGIHEASIIKTVYIPGFIPNLDASSQGIASNLGKLDGVKNVRISSKTTYVSGLEARRVSITADRWNGMFGVEALLVYDSKSSTFTMIQVFIAAQKGLTLSGVLTSQREEASKLLNTVSISN